MKPEWHRHPIVVSVAAISVFFGFVLLFHYIFHISAWEALTAIGTMLVAIVALFRERILRFLPGSPRLVANFQADNPEYFHHIVVTSSVTTKEHGTLTIFPSDSYNCLLSITGRCGL